MRALRRAPQRGIVGPMPVRQLLSALALALTSAACNGPFGLLPGGELSGEPAPTPSDWRFAGSAGTAQLETRAAEAYSVNLGYTVVEGSLYINAGNTETNWVKNISGNAEVRLRVDGRVYESRAVRVTEPAEIDAFSEAWTGQSFFRRDPRELDGEVWIYRIAAR